MLLTYVDESYSKDHYFIAGLAVHHESVRSFENSLNDVLERAQNDLGVGVYNWAFDAIAQHDVRVFLRGVNSQRLRERYRFPDDPHDVCLQHLLERINDYAKATGQAALIIADELHEHDRRRRDLRDFKDYGTPGYLSSRLPRIVDTIHFAPSHHSRLLQAADLVAFLHHRLQTGTETDGRASRANAALWRRIEGQIEHQWEWQP